MNVPDSPSGAGPTPRPRTWPTNDRTSFGLFVLTVTAVLAFVLGSPVLLLMFGTIGVAFALWGLVAQVRERGRRPG